MERRKKTTEMKFARYICAGEISSRDPSEGSQEISCTGLFMDSKLQADFYKLTSENTEEI